MDNVNSPSHYTDSHPVEVVEIITMILDEFCQHMDPSQAWLYGSELKYRLRAGHKGDAAEDIKKAMKFHEFRTTLPNMEPFTEVSPECYGVGFNSRAPICEGCMWSPKCKAFSEAYWNRDKHPACFTIYTHGDKECQSCQSSQACHDAYHDAQNG